MDSEETVTIPVRMTLGQKRALGEAAREAGLALSSWIRAVAIREADAVAEARRKRGRGE